MYSSGSSGPDTEKAMKHFNELLKEKANTTIKVTCLGWDNYENQYNLILTSGEKADLMYVNPNLYSRYASTGEMCIRDRDNGAPAEAWSCKMRRLFVIRLTVARDAAGFSNSSVI